MFLRYYPNFSSTPFVDPRMHGHDNVLLSVFGRLMLLVSPPSLQVTRFDGEGGHLKFRPVLEFWFRSLPKNQDRRFSVK